MLLLVLCHLLLAGLALKALDLFAKKTAATSRCKAGQPGRQHSHGRARMLNPSGTAMILDQNAESLPAGALASASCSGRRPIPNEQGKVWTENFLKGLKRRHLVDQQGGSATDNCTVQTLPAAVLKCTQHRP